MSRFTRLLPAFLSRTDIVIELRDSRLPLTSINPAFESEFRNFTDYLHGLAVYT
jgi:mitochondrial GTPase 1